MFLKADIVNGMINTMIIELIVYITSLIIIYYILHLNRKELIRITIIMFFKYIILNPLFTYLRNSGYEKAPYIYWMGMANILTFFVFVGLIKLATQRTYTQIFGVVSVFFDIVMVIFYMVPYNFFTIYWMESEPIFVGKNVDVDLLWKYAILMVYYALITIAVRTICKKYADKIIRFIDKTKVFVWIVMVADLGIGTVGYMYNAIFYDWRIFMYYILTVISGIICMYLISILVRRKIAYITHADNVELRSQNDNIKKHYNSIYGQMDDDRKFRHDLDKHMNVIKEMVDEGASEEEVKEYAESIKETYK